MFFVLLVSASFLQPIVELKGVLRQKRDLEQEISAKKLSLDEVRFTHVCHLRSMRSFNIFAHLYAFCQCVRRFKRLRNTIEAQYWEI